MNGTARLLRSRDDRMIAGVAGGIARYLGVDTVLVRLVFVLLAFTGPAILIYPLLALVMPKEPAGPAGAAPAGEPGQVFVAEGTQTQRLRIDPSTGASQEPHEVPINNIGQGRPAGTPEQRSQLLGYVLLGLGAFLVLRMLVPGFGHLLFPALLIGAGVYLLRRP